jgi:glyoxylase-like metal-dependent hydrolase (beta-lactamase superfamily II)
VHSLAAQNPDSVEITRQRLADGVYMLQGSGGNIGVSAGSDGVFIIDDQYAPLTEKVKAAVRGLSTAPIRFVINTHWHGDHTGGNENLARDGTLIVAHENVRKRMSVEQFIAAFNARVAPKPAAALPVVTFTDAVTFYLNGDTVDVLHVKAAHTDGDAIIHFRKANVIHTGDTFFNGFYPFIDASTGGSLDGMIGAADQALDLADDQTRIIPGHGPVATRADLKAFRDMLATVRVRLARAKIQGLTAEQVMNANLLADLDSTWGKGFLTPAQFLAVAYGSLSRP